MRQYEKKKGKSLDISVRRTSNQSAWAVAGRTRDNLNYESRVAELIVDDTSIASSQIIGSSCTVNLDAHTYLAECRGETITWRSCTPHYCITRSSYTADLSLDPTLDMYQSS
jgi:hypothetical protein